MTDKQNPENAKSSNDAAQSSKETEQGSSAQRLLNVGRQLQNRRRALKLSIKQASEQTRIRAEILKSIEANKLSDVSEPVYTRGFLRTYADHLGLDGEELVQLLDKQNQLPEEKEISLPIPADEGALPSRKWLLFSALALIFLGLAYQNIDWQNTHWPNIDGQNVDFVRSENPAAGQKQGQNQPNIAVPASGGGVNSQEASNKRPSPAFQTPQAAKRSGTEKTGQQAPQQRAQKKKNQKKKNQKKKNQKKQAQQQAQHDQEISNQPGSKQAVKTKAVAKAPDGARIRLYAKNDVWFEVKPEGADKPVSSKILTAGHSYWVPARDDLRLDVGLPPALVVFIDGQRMGKSGIIDRRVRGLPLKPTFLKESYFGQDVHLEPNIPTKKNNPDTNQRQTPSIPTPSQASGNDGVDSVVVDDDQVKIKNADAAE